MKKPFIKMHGLGNDFVIIDSRNNNYIINEKNIRLISNRRLGVGCDQVIEIKDSKSADIFMKIYNSDGSEAEACGNATRCVAGILFASSPKKNILIETVSGILKAESEANGNIKVDMGKPKLGWQDIPLSKNIDEINFEQFSLKNGFAVNLGNPHVVFFVEDLKNFKIDKIGPFIETNELFPQKVNVEICQIISDQKIRVMVWERGAGKTLACGSGACAVLVAAYKKGLSKEIAEIQLDGGSLNISWNVKTDNHLIMSGPVSVSFLGDFSTLGIEK
jgi:diaminopimelate epimerase